MGNELFDLHINMAQNFLKAQFVWLNGQSQCCKERNRHSQVKNKK